MSGPAVSSDGRAVKANHDPSGENAADSPTILTPDTMASVATTEGIAVTCGLAVGALDAGGLDAGGFTDGLGTLVGLAVLTAVDRGVALAEGDRAVTTGLAGGATDGVSVDDGAVVGSLVGRAMTRSVSSPAALVPTTTASLRTGDFEMDFGRICMSTCLEDPSLTGAQSGWRSAGQTSLTLVTL